MSHAQEDQQDYPSVTAAAAQAVAKQLDLDPETVRRWVVNAEIDAGARPGTTSAEHAEIKALNAGARRLEEANAILKAAKTDAGDRYQATVPSRRWSRVS